MFENTNKGWPGFYANTCIGLNASQRNWCLKKYLPAKLKCFEQSYSEILITALLI